LKNVRIDFETGLAEVNGGLHHILCCVILKVMLLDMMARWQEASRLGD